MKDIMREGVMEERRKRDQKTEMKWVDVAGGDGIGRMSRDVTERLDEFLLNFSYRKYFCVNAFSLACSL